MNAGVKFGLSETARGPRRVLIFKRYDANAKQYQREKHVVAQFKRNHRISESPTTPRVNLTHTN